MSALKHKTGFTIVELLIVIVVIGVLAAITIVAFNGLQSRARTSDVLSSLGQAKKKLELYKIDNGSYPLTGNLVASGVADGSVTYQYASSNGTTYCVTGTSGTTSYKVTDTTSATSGGCAGHAQGGQPVITNLVHNPSFESNLTSWTGTGVAGYTRAVSSARSQSGTNSLVITTGNTLSDFYTELYVDNVPPGTYTYSSYVYLTAAGGTHGGRRAWFHCSAGTCTNPGEPNYDTGILNQWQRLQRTITVSATANFRIRFYAPDNSTMYVDSVMVTSGSSAYSYLDGNSTNWAWTGVENNSTSSGPAP